MEADTEFSLFAEGVSLANNFSHWLRTHRERLGLTPEQMSVWCDLDVNTWAALENCEILEPSVSVADRVAAALGTAGVMVLFMAGLSASARRLGLR